LSFISCGIRLFGANLNPSGKITTAPTFKPPLSPFPKTCFAFVSYGIFTTASKTESGSTADGDSIIVGFEAKLNRHRLYYQIQFLRLL
jgi:hypothetical protein